jgi:type II secretory pathway predicted ATPase ExeA
MVGTPTGPLEGRRRVMDRKLSPEIPREIATDATSRKSWPDLDLMPSRRAGRDAIRLALRDAGGPVVLTGEPGVGKTSLRLSLEADRVASSRWVNVEVTPRTSVEGFYALIRHGLGLRPGGMDRPELAEFLEESSLDSIRWTLTIDESHNLDLAILEEIRILSNHLREPSGFEAILLVGQTPLARRLAGRALDGLASRLATHVHLRPLDADEVGLLLHSLDNRREWPIELVDRIHLMSGGRPARVKSLATMFAPAPRRLQTSPDSPGPVPPALRTGESVIRPEPLVGPSKPPILVEDGLIEVGWQPGSDSSPDDGGEQAGLDQSGAERSATSSIEGEERINDHYAALQAWQEWATNQGRHPEVADPEVPDEIEPIVADEDDTPTPLESTPNLWADEEHGFAPIGRLFNRAKQENEAE